MPSLHRARQQALVTVCASNLRQIGTALFLYSQQNNDKLPRGTLWNGPFLSLYDPAGNIPIPFVGDALLPYLADAIDMFVCPASPLRKNKLWKDAFKDGKFVTDSYPNVYIGYFYLGNYPWCLSKPGANPNYKYQIMAPESY